MASAGRHDDIVKLWDMATGKLLEDLRAKSGPVHSVVASDDRSLASGGDDRAVRLWNLPPASQEQWQTEATKPEPGRSAGQSGPPADPDKRIALVIGNSNYLHASRLNNPPNDARAIAAKFRDLGFAEVTEKHDLPLKELTEELKSFGDRARNANWAIIFFAGHGVEVGGINYLVPVDAELASADHIADEAVSLDRVTNKLEGAKKMRLAILDACRDNPFVPRMERRGGSRSAGRGLAKVEPEVPGLMVFYAAKDGQIALDGEGSHSPFSAALLEYLDDPKLEINLLIRNVATKVSEETRGRQLPFSYGFLTREQLFFHRLPSPPPASPPEPGPKKKEDRLPANPHNDRLDKSPEAPQPDAPFFEARPDGPTPPVPDQAPPRPVDPHAFTQFQNHDITGQDFKKIQKIGLKDCVKKCRSNSDCKAYTYDKWYRWCFLKNSIGVLRFDPQADSGVRSGAGEPVPMSAARIMQRFRGKAFRYNGQSAQASSFEDCEQSCLLSSTCVAMTYYASSGACRMMENVGNHARNRQADSSVKRQAAN